MKLEGEKILLTGGRGFIGRYLEAELKNAGAIVLSTGLSGVESESYIPVQLLDADKVTRVVNTFNPNYIIHMAAIASVTYENKERIYGINVIGTENLLAAAAQCPNRPTIMLTSTGGVYGNQDVEMLTESHPCNPVNHYSCSKMVMELMSRNYADSLQINIIRLFNIIGGGQSELFLIPKLVRHFCERTTEIHLGNISSLRDYVSVESCAAIIAQLVASDFPEPFVLNICSGISNSGYDVLEHLRDISGHDPKIMMNKDFIRSNEVWRMVGDPSKLHEYLGVPPQLPTLREILGKMYNNSLKGELS